jgi:hypothetical protein
MVEVSLLGAVLVGAALAANNVDHPLLAVGPAVKGPLQTWLVEAGPFGAAICLTLLAWHHRCPRNEFTLAPAEIVESDRSGCLALVA